MPKAKAPAANLQRSSAGRQERPVIARTLGILEAVAGAGRPVALSELAAEQEMPFATAFRCCQRLEEAGYLVRDGSSRRYVAGAGMIRLGLDIVRTSGPSQARHEILAGLVNTIGETCNLTALVGTDVLYLDRVETRWPLRLSLEPGSRVPLHCTSSGKLLLAEMQPEARDRLLSSIELTRHTPNTIIDVKALKRDLQRIARTGYSTNNEEYLVGIVGIAVPIKTAKGRTFAAIACHAPAVRLDLKGAIALVPALQKAAAKLAVTFHG